MTEKQRKFVHRFIETGNQTQSYMEVYKGCNSKSAATLAWKTLKKVDVQAYYQEMVKRTEDTAIASAKEVLKYFSGVMRGEIRDQFDLDPSLSDRTEAAKQMAKRYGLDKAIAEAEDIDLTINIVGAKDE